MATRITGLGISFSQFSDDVRSPRRGGGYPSPEAAGALLAAWANGDFQSPNTAGLQYLHPIPSFPGPLSCSHCRHLRSSSTQPPIPFVSFLDGCFSVSSGFFSSTQNPEIKGRSQAGPGTRVSPGSVLFASIAVFGWESLDGLVELGGVCPSMLW